ncbi:hypothetical protein GCM10014715_65690 [Streptomyces spiralis]|uniref:MFS transporter n=1 Tax=Streptomyces spiralis TaxID=66376 RepID=A0A919AE97_9ACTN|nr:hypothetical protein [Streptomyces spiralis]GHF00414.1 hypothetical protein GCM10014715_65690 [Streptomyces spiralis]
MINDIAPDGRTHVVPPVDGRRARAGFWLVAAVYTLGGVGVAQRLADPRRRADLLSTYFLFAYTGTIVPTLALGLLDQMINQDVATLLLAVTVVATTLAGALSRPATT